MEDQLLRDCLTRRSSDEHPHMPYDPTLQRDTARQLRANATGAEQKLWSRLRKQQLLGFRFRRQYPIGPFFADFVCIEAKLLIEVDGSQHAEREEQDQIRSAFLRANGFRMLRFWNSDVMSDVDSVVQRIAEVLGPTPQRDKRRR